MSDSKAMMWFWKEVYAAIDAGDKATFAAKQFFYTEHADQSGSRTEKQVRFESVVRFYHKLSDAEREALHQRLNAVLYKDLEVAA